MNETQLLNMIETIQWEIECTIGDRPELYAELDKYVLELHARYNNKEAA